ncbi:MAG: hypothetical protein ACE14L_08565 [Terriglobales bacterium]
MRTIQAQPASYQRLLLQAVGLGMLFSAPAWVYFLYNSADYPIGLGFVFVPVIAAGTVVLCQQLTRGEHPWGRKLLVSAVAAKLAAAGAYTFVMFNVYHGAGDAALYYSFGSNWAASFATPDGTRALTPFYSTNFVIMLTGALVHLLGNSLVTLIAFYALVAFWGEYFLYRAFRIGMPEGDACDFGLLAFLLPSAVFWSATVGKEALIVFGVGLCIYGYARAALRADPRGYVLTALGLAVSFLVRPHVAAMLGLALTASVCLSSNRRGLWGLLNKFVGVPLLLAATYFVATEARTFLNASDFQQGVENLGYIQRNSAVGGSVFDVNQGLTFRVLMSPFLMFRPFPWEVTNIPMALASLEGVALAVLCFRRRRSLLYALANWRSPLILFVLVYSLVYMVVFSAATSNFGVLTRQRVMVSPVALMLVCLPRAGWRVVAGRWTSRLRWSVAPLPQGTMPDSARTLSGPSVTRRRMR